MDTELGGIWIFPGVMVPGAIPKKKLRNPIGTPGRMEELFDSLNQWWWSGN